MRTQLSLILMSALALGACGEDEPVLTADAGADTSTGEDSSVGEDSGGGEDVGGGENVCGPQFAGPHGTGVGRGFAPISLIDCGGSEVSIPNADHCGARFLVISIGAGWCRPCQIESEQFEAEINERYADSDVQLIQILVQDEEFNPPSEAFCNAWVARYGLTNLQLRDPAQLSNIYFPAGALPSTIIVDVATGNIVFREVGAEEGLTSLRSAIDRLLAE